MTDIEIRETLTKEIASATAELKKKKEELKRLTSQFQRTTIHIRRDLLQRVRLLKHRSQKSIKQIFQEALEQYFDRENTQRIANV